MVGDKDIYKESLNGSLHFKSELPHNIPVFGEMSKVVAVTKYCNFISMKGVQSFIILSI